MDWQEVAGRERARYEEAGKAVLRGNAAYGAGLAALMAGDGDGAREWLVRAAARWRESWADATPTSWGRPIGVVKALLLAGDDAGAEEAAAWALGLGCEQAESPIGRYAAALALLALGRDAEAGRAAGSIRGRDDFPGAVADALACVAAHDAAGYAEAAEAVLESFESRDAYLEDVPVADTVLVLQALAARRGVPTGLAPSALLPPDPVSP
ncbi:MAG TPA: hypothetical protein VFB42_02880 [Gaiellaceae bacterium]|nr:hypothetical protein [Gaiellaceae bacterium]